MLKMVALCFVLASLIPFSAGANWKEALSWGSVSVLRHSDIPKLRFTVETTTRPFSGFGELEKKDLYPELEKKRLVTLTYIGISEFETQTRSLKTTKDMILYQAKGHYTDFKNRTIFYKEIQQYRREIGHRLLITSSSEKDLEHTEVLKAMKRVLDDDKKN